MGRMRRWRRSEVDALMERGDDSMGKAESRMATAPDDTPRNDRNSLD